MLRKIVPTLVIIKLTLIKNNHTQRGAPMFNKPPTISEHLIRKLERYDIEHESNWHVV